MDEFGVLVESIGFRAGGKSAPLADLKSKTKTSSVNNLKQAYTSNSSNGSFNVDLDGFFGSNHGRQTQSYGGFNDIFGGSIKSSSDDGFDFDFATKNSVSDDVYGSNDIFSGMPASKKPSFVDEDDVFGLNSVPKNQTAPIDDLFGSFGLGSATNASKKVPVTVLDDDLLPGFSNGSGSTRNEREKSEESWSSLPQHMNAEPTSLLEDPFIILKTSSSKAYKSSAVLSTADELEDFASAKVWSRPNGSSDYPKQDNWGSGTAADNLDIFFKKDLKSNNGSKPDLVMKKATGAKPTPPITATTKKMSTPNVVDDFSLLFGDGPSAEEFQEVEGESVERRKARLNHHMRTQERMAKALEEKNKRDHQTQFEQEERHRIAGGLDDDIKRWATGKEGNLRALLSSLQLILWPECGWKPVPLTDLITSVSVKKVYYKATLCVHPDKVQQKGASLHQKYTAEKVFDLLKEAWKKFNLEELR
ncbi:auxilin-related protein 1-like isoform X2 [Impatiens glandulifera]|uniref:auxilin-related protein 1-like isoform X2 n=1 Tax=Impatiens glandulifera TaxID=253017 RepID=UPI001FB15A01|nr:auxilin-related protein 1-like isoform X2 [Impatiens glandulifera]